MNLEQGIKETKNQFELIDIEVKSSKQNIEEILTKYKEIEKKAAQIKQ